MNKYGIQIVAEKKYIKLIHGILTNAQHSVRMTLFSSFLDITPQFDGGLEFYLKASQFLIKGK